MTTRNTIRTTALVVLMALLVACIAPIAAATEQKSLGTAKTTASINLRSGPGTEYTSLGKVKKGKSVQVLDLSAYSSGWVQVSYDGKTGYMTAEYLDLGEIAPHYLEPGVTKKTTRLRAEISTGSKTLATIPKNTQVVVLDNTTDSKWMKVVYKELEGYVTAADIKMGSEPVEEATTGTGTKVKKPTTADVNASKIASAKKTNSDTVGWIQVPGSNVDEPILYANNFYYANHDINKKKSYAGVYPYTNRATKNIVIFGHNLRTSGTIFHQIHHLQEAALGHSKCQYSSCKKSSTFSSTLGSWYKTKEGRVWNISIFGMQKWEVFAMYEVPKNEPISTLRNNWTLSPSNMKTWIDGQIKRSEINFGVSVSATDQVMTLITCGTNYDSSTANSRLFIFLKNVDS